MPIRIVDNVGRVGRIQSPISTLSSVFDGTHVAPPGRTGVLTAALGTLGGTMQGVFTPSASRSGVISAPLGALASIISGTSAPPVDIIAPSAPAGLAATATSSSQINLTWTASTDNVGVTGYRVERSADGSTGWAEIAQPATPSYGDTGLTASTQYFYRVRARDAAGNFSAYGATASATTQAASGAVLDLLDDFESGINRIVSAANSGFPSGGGGIGLFQPYTGDGAQGNTSVIASAARGGGFGLRYQITSGSGAYVDFDPVDNAYWYFAHEQMSAGNPWVQNKYNRLGFWVFVPTNMPMTTDPNRQGVEVGTYVRGKYDPATDNLQNWRVDPEAKGGWHFYHFITPRTGVWTYVVLDEHPQHSRESASGHPVGNPGAMNGVGSNIWPTATPGWNYMDALTRIYWNNWRTNASSFPCNILFDHWAFFSEPTGDVDNIATLEASWDSATNLLHVGFARNPSADPAFEAAWCAQDMNVVGFNAGTIFGTVGADGQASYVNKKIEGTVNISALPGVYVGVRRTGQTPFRQIYVKRLGVGVP